MPSFWIQKKLWLVGKVEYRQVLCLRHRSQFYRVESWVAKTSCAIPQSTHKRPNSLGSIEFPIILVEPQSINFLKLRRKIFKYSTRCKMENYPKDLKRLLRGKKLLLYHQCSMIKSNYAYLRNSKMISMQFPRWSSRKPSKSLLLHRSWQEKLKPSHQMKPPSIWDKKLGIIKSKRLHQRPTGMILLIIESSLIVSQSSSWLIRLHL